MSTPADRHPTSSAARTVRAGIVQWEMRPFASVDELAAHAGWYVDVLAGAGAQLVLFPEFFSIPLLALSPAGETPHAAMQRLAGTTPRIVDVLAERAQRHGTWIVAGSLPTRDGSRLLNSAFVLAPDGTRQVQHKLHATPGERTQWNIAGGEALTVVDTPFGRLGVLICYDVEFPEAARVLADRGVDILCVPSWTDTRAGYLRVRHCAAARAIENECYVLLAGSCGLLTGIDGVDSQYTRSAVLTPSDIAFPDSAVLAEADAGTAQYLLADLDPEKLAALRREGSVRNGRDRRRDLFDIHWRGR
ncbi:MAG: carbon-nitrogen hydrolase family protein [Pseudomonadota bacterium]